MNRGLLASVTVLVTIVLGGAAAASVQRSTGVISFVRGGDSGPTSVWIARGDGSGARRLAVGDEALLSPSGALLTVQNYTAHGPALELYSTSGKPLAGYFRAGQESVSALAWSADSRYLAISATSTKTVGQGSLYVVDTRTLATRLIAHGVFAGASFSGAGSQLVFGMADSAALSAPVNLYSAAVTGGARRQLTTNGNSFDPVWAGSDIVFARSSSRGPSRGPVFQLWLDAGGRLRQLTHMKIPDLLDGLSPLEADADGNRLIAEFTGTDTSNVWTVQLSPLRVAELRVDGQPVQGGEISSDGRRLLVDTGAFAQSPDHGEVEAVGFAGGVPIRLTRGAQPSWSG